MVELFYIWRGHKGRASSSPRRFKRRGSKSLSRRVGAEALEPRLVLAAPIALNDNFLTWQGRALEIGAPGVLLNDADADGDRLAAVLVARPGHGELVFNANGSFRYVPAGDFVGTDSFAYRASDANATEPASDLDGHLSNPAVVTIRVASMNVPPEARSDNYSTPANTTLTVAAPGVLANDSGAPGQVLRAVLVAGPERGELRLNADGGFTYAPPADFTGFVQFRYQAVYATPSAAGDSNTVASNIATVTIAVTPVERPVEARNDLYATAVNTPLEVRAPGVLANDVAPATYVLSARLETRPEHGTLVFNTNGSFAYTPAKDFSGTVAFTYRAMANPPQTDPPLGAPSVISNVATVTIHVRPVSEAPVANNDVYATPAGTALEVAAPGVLANDKPVSGQPLVAILDTAPSHGEVRLNADGSFRYVPAADFLGQDRFTYRAAVPTSTAAGANASVVSNVATVTIQVGPVNRPPEAHSDFFATAAGATLRIEAPGVLANDRRNSDRPLFASLVATTANGTLVLSGDGSLSYTPNDGFTGRDSFTYRACDGPPESMSPLPVLCSNVATVTIAVAPLEELPRPRNDEYRTPVNTPLSVAAPGVLANDLAAPDRPLTAALVTGPAHGTVALEANGAFRYVPNENFNGLDSFTYRVSGGATAAGSSDPNSSGPVATVFIRVGTVLRLHNEVKPLDVSRDDAVTSLDLLLIYNHLNSTGPGPVPEGESTADSGPLVAYCDVNGDNYVTALDALLVVNYLNAHPASEGESLGDVSPNHGAWPTTADPLLTDIIAMLAAEAEANQRKKS